jgi:hypothetical protein
MLAEIYNNERQPRKEGVRASGFATFKRFCALSRIASVLLCQLLALVGDQVDYGDSVCGAVLSLRSGEDIISVWNRDASDSQVSVRLQPRLAA